MITDEQLQRLIREAAEAVVPPLSGPEAVRSAAAAPAVRAAQPGPGRLRAALTERWRTREIVLAATGGAAVVALSAALATSGGPPTPVPFAYGGASHAAPPLAAKADGRSAAPLASSSASATSALASGSAAPGTATTGVTEVVATGTLTLRVPAARLRADAARLEALAISVGGYVSHASLSEAGGPLGGVVVVSVPAASFRAVVARAEPLGAVRSLTLSDQDVTARYVDLGARLSAQQDVRAQLEALLRRAGKVSDLLAVENQIAATQTQIDQLAAAQRSLAKQVSYSRLTVELRVATRVTKHHAPSGFSRAWHDAVSGFVGGIRALVAKSGVVLFSVLALAALAALVLGAGRLAWTAARRRSA
ncbi:MAG TPA: DUF4349 domain-containing protein [Acidimicrobiales bacterium]|nr:DUF4349 domain-containing protein [Acidimicrobiales bacterium]